MRHLVKNPVAVLKAVSVVYVLEIVDVNNKKRKRNILRNKKLRVIKNIILGINPGKLVQLYFRPRKKIVHVMIIQQEERIVKKQN